MFHEVFAFNCFLHETTVAARRLRHWQLTTPGFPCQSNCYSHWRMRKNLQNHQQRFRIYRRRLRFGAGFAFAVEDMEFVQFHPTGIYGLGILISEAARAEGGFLRNGLGERFMERYAPTLKDLAPRDIISRAILKEIREGKGVDGKDYVYLDLRGIGKERLAQKLPEITSFIKTYLGIDPAKR